MLQKKHQVPASTKSQRAKLYMSNNFRPLFFAVKRRLFRSVKNKKLFEQSEFFLFSVEKCRSRQKNASRCLFFVSFLLDKQKK